MPLLSFVTALFVFLHIHSTNSAFGFPPRYVPDMDPGTPIDLGILYYLRAAAVLALPFLAVYLLCRFWPKLKAVFRRARTDPSTSSG
jgi:hypothetical protein